MPRITGYFPDTDSWIGVKVGADGTVATSATLSGEVTAATEYTEDAAAIANPVGGMVMARRRDTPAGETTTDGDVIALNATDKGELYVKHIDAVPVTDNGGSLTVDNPVLSDVHDAINHWIEVNINNSTLAVTQSGSWTIAAGNNNIGDVDIASIAAGDNNIGNVDVVTLPALPAGTNNIGDVDVLSLPATPAGTNLIGRVNIDPQTGNGLTIFRSIDLDESEEEVKATTGAIYGLWFTNTATTTRWLKFYNATTANVTVGTTTPIITIALPGNTSDDITGVFSSAFGIVFDTAITVAATTGVADNDTGAPGVNEVIVNIFYK